MKIGELAAQAECDIETVRYYERSGLLEAPARETFKHRRYTDHHLARLRFIRHCRALDIPLGEVRQLLSFSAAPAENCSEVDALLDRHVAQARRRLQALHELDGQLAALRARCAGDTGRDCAILASFLQASAAPCCNGLLRTCTAA